jgi:ATP-dependent DNA helicase RecG
MAALPRLSDLPDSTDLATLLAVIGELEGSQLEFKREPAKLKELVPAFAMTEGGLIVLGLDDRRHVHGCELSQKHQDAITRVGKDVGVDLQFKEISVDGSPVVVVAVPEVRQRIVTTTDGRLLRRVGSDIHPLVGDQLARFVREREEVSGEEAQVPATASSDFDLDLINEALAADGKVPVGVQDVARALIDLDVAVPQPAPADPAVLVAGVVMFAKNPQQFVSGASVQLIRRAGVGPGTGPAEAREEYSGPIPTLLDLCLDFIDRHTKKYQVVIGTRRQIWAEYPEEVLREAMLNALAHRDYGSRGATVDVTVWEDRLEIRSPGGLPGPITLDNIRSEHYSRNRRIMRSLKTLDLVEEYGEGVDRMFDLMEARLMEPPLITPTPTSVSVTLRNRFLVSVEEQAWLAALGHMQLSGPERRVLAVTRREGAITRRRVKQLIPTANADNLLRGAVAKGLLVRVGQAGGVRYLLSDEVVMRAGSSGVEAQSRKRQMLLDEIRQRGSLSTAEGADLLGEEMIMVRHLLNDLVAGGDAVARGQTRARRYYAR